MGIDISPDWKKRVKKLLPDLEEGVTFEFSSPVDYNYNCLSWALSCSTRVFENAKGAFWPWKHIPDDTLDGWAKLCEIHGFSLTDNADHEAGYEKIAILQDLEGGLHATRQDRDGKWKSKLGDMGPDIDHVGLDVLEVAYGKVVRVLKKRRPDWE